MRDSRFATQVAHDVLVGARDQIKFVLDALSSGQLNECTNEPDDVAMLKIAERMILERKHRNAYFSNIPFGEPVWDILLDLFVAHAQERSISVSSVCLAANVPPTTALRYTAHLENEGVLERRASKTDARVFYLSLSASALEAMRTYLRQIARRQRNFSDLISKHAG
jgi:DNA-binding MarR family transcriptional regulator